jgi:hypothetical protein
MPTKDETKRELKKLEVKEEEYVIDLCDEALDKKALRHHKFEFLLGDLHRNGKTRSQIPCDAYYPDLKMVVEFNGYPHSKESKARQEQSLLYAQRKREVLEEHKIRLLEINYDLFGLNEKNQILRNKSEDFEKVKTLLTSGK